MKVSTNKQVIAKLMLRGQKVVQIDSNFSTICIVLKNPSTGRNGPTTKRDKTRPWMTGGGVYAGFP